MNIIFKKLNNIYLKLFLLRPKLLSTFIFIPFLYILGWLISMPLILFGVEIEKISLIGTILTFVIFVISMPKWFKVRWGYNKPWNSLGVKEIDSTDRLIFFYFLKGFLYSIIFSDLDIL